MHPSMLLRSSWSYSNYTFTHPTHPCFWGRVEETVPILLSLMQPSTSHAEEINLNNSPLSNFEASSLSATCFMLKFIREVWLLFHNRNPSSMWAVFFQLVPNYIGTTIQLTWWNPSEIPCKCKRAFHIWIQDGDDKAFSVPNFTTKGSLLTELWNTVCFQTEMKKLDGLWKQAC